MKCNGLTRTGRLLDMGMGYETVPCVREATHLATLNGDTRHLCRYHAAAFARKFRWALHGKGHATTATVERCAEHADTTNAQ